MSSKLKLKTAAEEIKDILRKYDLAGSIALHTDGNGEFLIHLTTSYSCAYQYDDGIIRLYSQSNDETTPEERMEKIRTTANMLKILTDCTGINFQNLYRLSQKIDKITNAEHTPPKIS